MKCIACNREINPLRLKALPGTKTCVDCSNVGAKRGVVITGGEGEDTFNDLVILEEDQYKKYLQQTGQTEEYLDLEEEGDAESETTI
jgi:hypothetical protein